MAIIPVTRGADDQFDQDNAGKGRVGTVAIITTDSQRGIGEDAGAMIPLSAAATRLSVAVASRPR